MISSNKHNFRKIPIYEIMLFRQKASLNNNLALIDVERLNRELWQPSTTEKAKRSDGIVEATTRLSLY